MMLLSGWIDSSGWVHCPVCGNKTRTKVNRDTVLKRFPLFCPKCGHEHIIDVQENKIVSLEPDAKTQWLATANERRIFYEANFIYWDHGFHPSA